MGFSQMGSVNSDCRRCGFRLQCLVLPANWAVWIQTVAVWIQTAVLACQPDGAVWIHTGYLLHKQQQGIKGLVCAFSLFLCLLD